MPPPAGQPYRGAYLQDRLTNDYGPQTKAQLEANLDRIYKLIRGINDNGELPEGAESAVLVYLNGAWAILEFDETLQRVIGNSSGEPAWEQVDLALGVTGRLPFANLAEVAESKLLGRGEGAGTGNAQEITLGTGLTMTGTTLDAAGGAGGSGWVPVVDGSEPPVFITDGLGVLILVAGP
jgi:hypothetical protein